MFFCNRSSVLKFLKCLMMMYLYKRVLADSEQSSLCRNFTHNLFLISRAHLCCCIHIYFTFLTCLTLWFCCITYLVFAKLGSNRDWSTGPEHLACNKTDGTDINNNKNVLATGKTNGFPSRFPQTAKSDTVGSSSEVVRTRDFL